MVGTLTEAVEMRREKKTFEEISDWEMKQLPRGLRIDIPLKSTMEIRKVAPALRQFADMMERESKRKDLTPVQILRNVWAHNRSLRAFIENVCRSGWIHRKMRDSQDEQ